MTNVTSLAAAREARANPLSADAINAAAVRAAGWRRVDSATMLFVGEPYAEGSGRDALQLKGSGGGLAITAAYLPPGVDPDDDAAVLAELEGEWSTVLPLPALIVLASSLDMCIGVLDAATPARA